jgi:7-cyano-7-deazaguanine reductase
MSDRHEHLNLLGNNPNPDSITADQIETFPAPEGVGLITFNTDEFTSLCPKTGQPDFYELGIAYYPNGLCIESKALKLYLRGFRETGQFIEELVVQIRDDLVKVCEPASLRVFARMAPRGGIDIEAESIYSIGE